MIFSNKLLIKKILVFIVLLFVSVNLISALEVNFFNIKKSLDETSLDKIYTEQSDIDNLIKNDSINIKNNMNNLSDKNWIDVSTEEDFRNIPDNSNLNYRLINDINLNQKFQPIKNFSGILDGQGYSVTGLFIDNPLDTTDGIGMFSNINNACIINISFNDSIVNLNNLNFKNYSVGILTGNSSNSYIANVIASGEIDTNADNVGIIAGSFSNGKIINVGATGNIKGNNNVGGLVGKFINSSVYLSYFNGSIFGENYLGGLIGTVNNIESVDSFSSYIFNNYTASFAEKINTTIKSNNQLSFIGAFIGNLNIDSTYLSNNYYDLNISSTKYALGNTESNLTNIQGKLTKEMIGNSLKSNLDINEFGFHFSENMYPSIPFYNEDSNMISESSYLNSIKSCISLIVIDDQNLYLGVNSLQLPKINSTRYSISMQSYSNNDINYIIDENIMICLNSSQDLKKLRLLISGTNRVEVEKIIYFKPNASNPLVTYSELGEDKKLTSNRKVYVKNQVRVSINPSDSLAYSLLDNYELSLLDSTNKVLWEGNIDKTGSEFDIDNYNGILSIKIRSKYNNNYSQNQIDNVYIDNILPEIKFEVTDLSGNIVTDYNNWHNSPLKISAYASDDISGVKSVFIAPLHSETSPDISSINDLDTTNKHKLSASPTYISNEGYNVIKIYAIDNSMNINEISITLKLDMSKPETNGIQVIKDTINVNDEVFRVNINYTDTVSGIYNIKYKFVDINQNEDEIEWKTYNNNHKPIIQDKFRGEILAIAEDNAGNISEIERKFYSDLNIINVRMPVEMIINVDSVDGVTKVLENEYFIENNSSLDVNIVINKVTDITDENIINKAYLVKENPTRENELKLILQNVSGMSDVEFDDLVISEDLNNIKVGTLDNTLQKNISKISFGGVPFPTLPKEQLTFKYSFEFKYSLNKN